MCRTKVVSLTSLHVVILSWNTDGCMYVTSKDLARTKIAAGETVLFWFDCKRRTY